MARRNKEESLPRQTGIAVARRNTGTSFPANRGIVVWFAEAKGFEGAEVNFKKRQTLSEIVSFGWVVFSLCFVF